MIFKNVINKVKQNKIFHSKIDTKLIGYVKYYKHVLNTGMIYIQVLKGRAGYALSI